MNVVLMDPRLREWREKHRPLCPACGDQAMPIIACARVWAPEWAAEYYGPFRRETEDDTDELVAELRHRLEEAERAHALLAQDTTAAVVRLEKQKLDLFVEVEKLRRENAKLRQSYRDLRDSQPFGEDDG